jgi:hypothetical protein
MFDECGMRSGYQQNGRPKKQKAQSNELGFFA